MASCIKSVKGLPSDSASPTDTWVVSFKDGAMYEDIPIKTGFIKLWLSSKSAEDRVVKELGTYDTKVLYGLEYEVDVYRDVISPMIDNQICPNFVRYLGMGRRCTYQSLLNMLSSPDRKDYDNFRMALTRNLMYCIKRASFRPSIHDFSRVYKSYEEAETIMKRLQFDFVMTKTVGDNAITLKEYIKKTKHNIGFDIVLQILMACEAMRMVRMVHNDLHYGNIWLVPIDKQLVTYKIGENVYTFMTSHKVMVYDFDRSYVEYLGNNRVLTNKFHPDRDGSLCIRASACNQFIPGKDAMKIFWYLLPKTIGKTIDYNNVLSSDLLYILAPKEYHDSIKRIYNIGPFLLDENKVHIQEDAFKGIHTIQTMIDECYIYVDEGYEPTDDKNSTFVMS